MDPFSFLEMVLPAPGLRKSLNECVKTTYLLHHGRNDEWAFAQILQTFLRRSAAATQGKSTI